MPYDISEKEDRDMIRERLERTYLNVSEAHITAFGKAFNYVYYRATNGDEGRSMAAGYAAVNKLGAEKKPPKPKPSKIPAKKPAPKRGIIGTALLASAQIPSQKKNTEDSENFSVSVACSLCPSKKDAQAIDQINDRAYCVYRSRRCRQLQLINGSTVTCRLVKTRFITDDG